MRLGVWFLICIGLWGCATTLTPHRKRTIYEALEDLAAAGFEFDADVHFMPDQYAVCDDMSCADVLIYKERRTILVAHEAFESPSRIRATLLEIWPRYQNPRPGFLPDLARGALQVVQDGPRVGIEDVYLLRRAQHTYRRLYDGTEADQRDGLVDPNSLPFP